MKVLSILGILLGLAGTVFGLILMIAGFKAQQEYFNPHQDAIAMAWLFGLLFFIFSLYFFIFSIVATNASFKRKKALPPPINI